MQDFELLNSSKIRELIQTKSHFQAKYENLKILNLNLEQVSRISDAKSQLRTRLNNDNSFRRFSPVARPEVPLGTEGQRTGVLLVLGLTGGGFHQGRSDTHYFTPTKYSLVDRTKLIFNYK